MFINMATITTWYQMVSSKIAVLTDRSTKLRLEQARKRRGQLAAIGGRYLNDGEYAGEMDDLMKRRLERARQRRELSSLAGNDCLYDNSLLRKIDALFSLQQIEHSQLVAWRHWTEGKQSSRNRLSQEKLNNLDLRDTRELDYDSEFKGLTAGIEQDYLERAYNRIQASVQAMVREELLTKQEELFNTQLQYAVSRRN